MIALGTVTVTGNVFLTQGDGAGNFLEIVGAPGYTNTIGGNLFITQGNGSGDSIDVEDATVSGNASFEVGNGSGDTINIETTSPDGIGVTFSKNVSIEFGNGGGATLNVGTDGDPVTFDGKATFSAGGTGNTYNQGPDVTFQPGQPKRHGI